MAEVGKVGVDVVGSAGARRGEAADEGGGIGVENAIYLVGADAYGFCRSEEGDMETFHSTDRSYGNFKNNNSIVWRAKQTP